MIALGGGVSNAVVHEVGGVETVYEYEEVPCCFG